MAVQQRGDGLAITAGPVALAIAKTGQISDVRLDGKPVLTRVGLEVLDASGRLVEPSPADCEPLDVADTFSGVSIVARGNIASAGNALDLAFHIETRFGEDGSIATVATISPRANCQVQRAAWVAEVPAAAVAGREIWYNPRGEAPGGGEPQFRPGFSVSKPVPATPAGPSVVESAVWIGLPLGENKNLELVTRDGNTILEDRRPGTDSVALVSLVAYAYPNLAAGDRRPTQMVIRPPRAADFAPSPQGVAARDAFEVATAIYGEAKYERAIEKLAGFVAAHPSYREAAIAQYYLADCHYHLKDYAKAVDAYQTLIDRYPANEAVRQARFRRAESLFRLERLAEAAEAFSGLGQSEGTGDLAAAARYWAGECHYKLGHFEPAMGEYRASIVASDVGKYAAFAYYAIGLCQTELGHTEDALGSFQTVVDRYQEPQLVAECRFRIAQARAGSSPAEAAKSYEAFLQSNPESPLRQDALFGLAGAQLRSGAIDEALAGFRKLLADFPDGKYTAECRRGVADCLFLKKDFAAARDAYAATGPGEAAFWAARCDQELGSADQALAGFREWVAQNAQSPRAAEAHLQIGDLLAKQSNLDGAQAAYQACLDAKPSDEVARGAKMGLAWVQYQRDKSDESLKALQALAAETGDTRTATVVGLEGASQKLASGDADGALAALDAVDMASLPADAAAQARALRGRALLRKGDATAALAQFDQALASGQSPARPAALAGRVGALAALGKTQEARTALEELTALGAAPEVAARARYDLAEALLKAGQFEAAESEFASIVQGKAEGELLEYSLLGLAYAQAGRGQHEPAVTTLKDLLNRFPNGKKAEAARLQLARSLSASGHAEEAANALAAAGGDTPQALLELGCAEQAAGRSDQAKARFTEIVEKHPASPEAPEALFRLGEIAFAAEDYDAALTAYDRALGSKPDADLAARCSYKKGWALRRKGQPEPAIACFEAASRGAEPEAMVADALYQWAYCLVQLGRRDEALPVLLRCAKEHPAAGVVPAAWRAAGDCQRQAGELDEARQSYQTVLRDFGTSTEATAAQVGLAACEQLAGNHEAVLKALEAVPAGDRSELGAEALCLRAASLLALDRVDEALDAFERAAILFEAFPEWAARGQFGVGMCEEKKGRTDDAKRSYQSTIDRFGATAAAEAARKRLTELGG